MSDSSDQPDRSELAAITPDRVFDGGDLDCGSGLALLIRDNLLQVPEGGVLEMRSREPSVADDLPPWCRLVGHELLGSIPGPGFARYLLRRAAGERDAPEQLEEDKGRANAYEWRTRTRVTGRQKSTVYCRNFSFDVGQTASFEEKDQYPSAVELLLGALSASLATGFATESSRIGLDIDDVEITCRGRVENVLAILGIESGEPAFSAIDLRAFVSTVANESVVRAAWDRAVHRNPILNTLRKAAEVTLRISIL